MARKASGSPNRVVTSRKLTFGFGQSRTVRTRPLRNAARSDGFMAKSSRSGTSLSCPARKTCILSKREGRGGREATNDCSRPRVSKALSCFKVPPTRERREESEGEFRSQKATKGWQLKNPAVLRF